MGDDPVIHFNGDELVTLLSADPNIDHYLPICCPVQVRWSHAAPGLPLRVGLCTRRFNFLKKNKSSSKFIASLEAQVSSTCRAGRLGQQIARGP